MLFPHAIKTLTNNTELISTCNILGYRVCYSIIQELATENAYRISNLQENCVILRVVNEKKCKRLMKS